MVYGLMVMILGTKTKNISITKNKSLSFFCEVYYRKKHVIPNYVIGAILDVILNI